MVDLALKPRITHGRGHLVNRDQVSLTSLGIDLQYYTVPKFTENQLPRLYAAVCEVHNFEMWRRHDTGADRVCEGVCDVTIGRNKLKMWTKADATDEVLRRRLATIAGVVKDQLSIRKFGDPTTTIEVLWPLPGGDDADARDALRNTVVGLEDEDFEFLKATNIQGAAIRVSADTKDLDHLKIEIGPYMHDYSQLSIELTNHRHIEMSTPGAIQEHLKEVQDYFEGHVIPFVENFMP